MFPSLNQEEALSPMATQLHYYLCSKQTQLVVTISGFYIPVVYDKVNPLTTGRESTEWDDHGFQQLGSDTQSRDAPTGLFL